MKKTKKRNVPWWWIAGTVIVFTIIATGILISNKKSPSPQVSSQYKTYQDKTYGFQIEYPQAWEIKKDTQVFEKGDVIAFRKEGPSQKKYTELADGAQLAVSKPFTIDTELTVWMKSYFSDQAKFSTLPLANYTFEVVEDCQYMGCMRYYFTTIDSQIYGIALYADGTNDEKASYENALLYMLKSLQFSSQSNGAVTEEDAVLHVKSLPEVVEYFKRVPNGMVAVNGQEDAAYMVQVYEVKDGHTATFNWYSVDKTTGKVTKEF